MAEPLIFADEMRKLVEILTPGPGDMEEILRAVVMTRVRQEGEANIRAQFERTLEASADDGNDSGVDEYTEGLKKSAAKDAANTMFNNVMAWAR